jgi:SAM-dependent methyltransferase
MSPPLPDPALEHLEGLYRTAEGVRTARLTAETSEPVYRDYVDFIAGVAPAGGRVLDVGCGCGWSTHWLAERGFDATGVDLNPAAFEPAPHARLRFAPGSGLDLPFPDGAFDAVAACQVIEHVPDPARMLDEMVRVAHPGGVACVVGPNLLGLGPSAAALTRYIWRAGSVRRAFVRTPDMPRHPFGNTAPEMVAALVRNLALIARKTLSRRPTFTLREPDTRPPFSADNDAVYLCNPLDLTRYFRRRGCTVLRDAKPGRPGWARMLAGGTWVAARTPPGPRGEPADPRPVPVAT